MPITYYAPNDMKTAGNIQIIIFPACANIEKPTVAELGAGTAFPCATKSLDLSTEVKKGPKQYLCDKEERETVESRKRTIGQLWIAQGDPQAANAFTDKIKEDSHQYVYVAGGLDFSRTDPKAGDKGRVYYVQIASIDWDKIDPNADFALLVDTVTKKATTTAVVAA